MKLIKICGLLLSFQSFAVPALAQTSLATISVDAGAVEDVHGTLPAGALTPQVRVTAMDTFAAYASALKARDFASAYGMLRLSFQAANPRLEWEMNLRKRDALWADASMRLLRSSWYVDPQGQPSGLYVAYDFRGDRVGGGMDCGYVVMHQVTANGPFSVVRTDTSFVPVELMKEGVPQMDVLHQLPCFLGKGIRTAL